MPIAVLRKSDRELLGVCDTVREAKALRAQEPAETITEILGSEGYIPRISR